MAFATRNLVRIRRILEYQPSVGIPSIYAKCIPITTCLPQRNQPKMYPLCRQFHSHNNKGKFDNKFILKSIVPVGVITYLLYKKKYLDWQIFPEVKAATKTSLRNQYNFIADVVELSSGAVVCIDIKDSRRLDFFGWSPQPMTNGSGFIIDESGLILTNAHVVMGHPQSSIQVKLADGTIYPATIEDIDVKSDLACIRVKPKGKIAKLNLGESKSLRPGEWVIAMGSPLTLSNTVTAGIVSSVNRTSSELNLFGRDMHYIQTDASITFGNSGGPLINLDGEVVGINSMKVAQAGISFAIPVEYAKDFLERSKNRKLKGTRKRYLGLTMLALNDEIVRELQFRNHYVPHDLKEGVIVWKVVVESPAHKSGLMPGDIIVEINGKPVRSSNAVYDALEKDTVLNVRFYRGHTFFEAAVYPEDID